MKKTEHQQTLRKTTIDDIVILVDLAEGSVYRSRANRSKRTDGLSKYAADDNAASQKYNHGPSFRSLLDVTDIYAGVDQVKTETKLLANSLTRCMSPLSDSHILESLEEIDRISNLTELTRKEKTATLSLCSDSVNYASHLGWNVGELSGCLPRSIAICAALVSHGIACRWKLGASRFEAMSDVPLHAWAETISGEGLASYVYEDDADTHAILYSRVWL